MYTMLPTHVLYIIHGSDYGDMTYVLHHVHINISKMPLFSVGPIIEVHIMYDIPYSEYFSRGIYFRLISQSIEVRMHICVLQSTAIACVNHGAKF